MKYRLLGLLMIATCSLLTAQDNVGIGIADPAARLHLHKSTGAYTAFMASNNLTGSSSEDGLQLIMTGVGDALLQHQNSNDFILGTDGTEQLYLLPNGKFGMNTDLLLGASDLTLKSSNPTGWGGMYVQSPDASGGKPFYGYATGNLVRAYHYYDQASSSLRFYMNGDRFTIFNDGRVGVNTASVDASAILQLNSTTKGFLPPSMTTTQREAIASPAEGLMVYDNTLNKPFIHDGANWKDMGAVGGGLWSEDNSPVGAYYDTGLVGIGAQPNFLTRLNVNSGTGNPFNGYFASAYTGGLTTYGIYSLVPGSGTGVRYGMYGKAVAPSGSNTNAYGLYGLGTANGTASSIYGVFGNVNGTGTGTMYAVYGFANGAGNFAVYGKANHADAYAGYFEGEVQVGSGPGPDGNVRLDGAGWSSGGTVNLYDNDGTRTVMIRGNQTTAQGSELIMAADDGSETVELDAQISSTQGAFLHLRDVAGQTRVSMAANEVSGQGSAVKLYDNAGNLTIEMDADFEGNGRVITDELEIVGGSDLAEYFSSSDKSYNIKPGHVVVIDNEDPGKVKISNQARDKKVVGIVSGANGVKPGMLMGQRESIAFGDLPVAIAGRVYVVADESAGAIEPGDFLTTSDKKGAAMKVNNWNKARGAVLGKALSRVDDNGYVLVLVNLQ